LAVRSANGSLADARTIIAAENGVARFDGELPGEYAISVHRSTIDEWAAKYVDLDDDRTLDISIPMTRVRGSIRLGYGPLPAEHAIIDIAAPDGDFKQLESADGIFTVSGLAAGSYKLTAQARDAESETPEVVTISDDQKSHVTLPVKRVVHFRGEIRSSFGPIMNAAIFAKAAGTEPPVVMQLPVDNDGRF